MTSLTSTPALALAPLAAGRGESAGDAGGVLIVVGIALAAVIVAAGALLLAIRVLRARREADRSGRTAHQTLPSEEGRPWSSER